MEDVKIKLSALWVAVMFCYVYAAVLDNYKPGILEGMIAGEVDGIQITQEILFGNAVLMVIPSVMVFLSLTLKAKVNRWANIIVAIFFFGFNLLGLPTYPSAYDRFLSIVSTGFNVLTVWYARKWV